MTTTNTEIADLLRDYAQAKRRVQELRSQCLQIAVESFGMEQEQAKKLNLETFLDGYLVGQGMMQSWRKSPAQEAAHDA